MKLPFSLIVLVLLNFGCVQSKVKHITEFSQNDAKNGILVDVRTRAEFMAGHLQDALNIDWNDPDFAEQFKSMGKDETIYVYCKKGGRSAKAQEKLNTLGYKNVINLEGGYDAWAQKKD